MTWLAFQATLGALLALATVTIAIGAIYGSYRLVSRTRAAWRLRTWHATHRPRRPER